MNIPVHVRVLEAYEEALRELVEEKLYASVSAAGREAVRRLVVDESSVFSGIEYVPLCKRPYMLR